MAMSTTEDWIEDSIKLLKRVSATFRDSPDPALKRLSNDAKRSATNLEEAKAEVRRHWEK
jgi:hypothetical protein